VESILNTFNSIPLHIRILAKFLIIIAKKYNPDITEQTQNELITNMFIKFLLSEMRFIAFKNFEFRDSQKQVYFDSNL
jgi:hypothetical protein